MGPSAYIDYNFKETELTEDECNLRVEFVRAYLRTQDPYVACIELGFLEPYAMDWANSFMAEGVVRRLIAEAEQAEDTEETVVNARRKHRAWLEKQANYYGPGASHGARVNAIVHLMKLNEENAPSDMDGLLPKGGVMVVPLLMAPDKWQEFASASQEELKRSVQD